MSQLLALVILVAMSIPAISAPPPSLTVPPDDEEDVAEKIDDWQFDQSETLHTKIVGQSQLGGSRPPIRQKMSSPPQGANLAIGKGAVANLGSVALSPAKSLGFAVGGAKDTGSFTQNLEEGYLPKYDSITYEGLFYDYYFDTGIGTGLCDTLFCPSFTKAITRDLYSGETDYYLNIGLNSGLTEENFQRKKLNLVLVVDISGSMGSRFNKYYYDSDHRKQSEDSGNKTKMQIANESIVAMMQHLADDDRFGVILFDTHAYRAKPLRLVRHTDMKAIAGHILDLKHQGGTNWRAGYDEGLKLFDSFKASLMDPSVYENRIIFITDAMPNVGELSKKGLFGMVRDAAQHGIFTSFIGVGIDFNADLVEQVTKTRGANYFSVHSAAEFKKRLADEFDFMVTPLVFDLELQVSSKDFAIEGVFGSPEANLATGEVMKINTLFPSSTEDEQVKGGVILVKLKKSSQGNGQIALKLHYKDRQGKQFKVADKVDFGKDRPGFDNNGVRKAVLLTEYVSLIKNWLLDAHKGCNDQLKRPIVLPLPRYGLVNPLTRPEMQLLPTWERKSCKLDISPGYRNFFTLFSKHFKSEMQVIGDKTLEKELKVLMKLSDVATESAPPDTGPVDDWEIKR